MKTLAPGKFPNTVSYFTGNGEKVNYNNGVDYGPTCIEGDNLTMIINMH